MRRLIVILMLLIGSVYGSAPAPVQANEGQERARAAVKAGEIRPLQEILERVRGQVGGRVLDAELAEAGRDRWTYRIKVLTGDGRVLVLAVDARTGEVLRIRGR